VCVPALSDNFHVRSSVPDGSDVRIDTLCVPALAASTARLEASLFALVAAFLSRSDCGFAGGCFVINVVSNLPCIVVGMVRGGVSPAWVIFIWILEKLINAWTVGSFRPAVTCRVLVTRRFFEGSSWMRERCLLFCFPVSSPRFL